MLMVPIRRGYLILYPMLYHDHDQLISLILDKYRYSRETDTLRPSRPIDFKRSDQGGP